MREARRDSGRLCSQISPGPLSLIGEHVVDFHELRRLGGSWPHDSASGAWSPTNVRKLNADQRPVNLSLNDLPRINQPGLDAVWQHGAGYTVTEAKASESVAAAYAFGKYKEKKGLIPTLEGLSPDLQLLHYLLSDASDQGGKATPLMQMGKAWVEDRARREGLSQRTAENLAERNAARYTRRVAFVTFEAPGATVHASALIKLHQVNTAAQTRGHEQHDLTREWDGQAVDAVEASRKAARKRKVNETSPRSCTPATGSRSKSRSPK